jgi:hypothetical protein
MRPHLVVFGRENNVYDNEMTDSELELPSPVVNWDSVTTVAGLRVRYINHILATLYVSTVSLITIAPLEVGDMFRRP